ncbi:MAG TPA: hypothetical protein PK431_00400 [Chitinophagales bacterium]|nr:hypothetical protein [Chitinophagales bacterium]
MKKLLLGITVVMAIGMTSCRKDYTCSCKEKNGGAEFESTSYPSTSLVDARSNCKDRQSFWQNSGAKPAAECTVL